MTTIRPEEIWAKACIEQALPGARVCQHDDGSESSMYDLTLTYPNGSIGAVEITRAADKKYIELSRALDKRTRRWQEPSLTGTWWVRVLPSANARDLRQQLPDILRGLESDGVTEVRGNSLSLNTLTATLGKLGIIAVTRQAVADHEGRIFVVGEVELSRMGGFTPAAGDPLVHWLGEWLAEPARSDNIQKLAAAHADERHLFIFVANFAPPAKVTLLLTEDNPPLPTISPELPAGITHVWVMSMWVDWGNGLRWSPDRGWERFEKVRPPVERQD
jgi:hypothetical protein